MAWTRRGLILGAAALGAPFPAHAAQTIALPFRLARNRAWVAVQLNGKPEPRAFLIDTASYGYAITNSLAKAIGLPRATKFNALTLGGRVNVPVYSADWAVIGGAMRDSNICLVGLTEASIPEGDGILPMAQYSVASLDYDLQRLTVSSELDRIPEGYAALDVVVPRPMTGSLDRLGSADHSALSQGHLPVGPIVKGELDGNPLNLLLATGTDVGLFLYPDYVKKHGLWDSYGRSIPSSINTEGGPAPTRLVKGQRFKLGNVVLQSPVVMLGRPQDSNRDGTGIIDGLVGMELLRRFNMVYDRQHRRVWLRANGSVADGYRYDRAGVNLATTPGGVVAGEVEPESPAGRAGLRTGDRIVGWTGQSTLVGLAWAFTGPPGSRIELEVERTGETRSVTLELADRL